MANFYVMEAVNLFCGDHDPETSKYLTLKTLTLPTLEEITADHAPGGSFMSLQVGMGTLEPLEAGFSLAGEDPQLLSMFGLGARKREFFTAYGVVKDKRTSEEIESKAVIQARLGRIAPDDFERGELRGHEYGLTEIWHYQVHFAQKEKYFMDFFTQQWRVDGVSQNATANRIMRIPGASAS